MCQHCFHLTKANVRLFQSFNNFSDTPECMKALRNYADFRKIYIGTLFCSTFCPHGYTYTHIHGMMSFGINNSKKGMLGILNEESVKTDSSADISIIKPVLQRLQKNKFLYSSYLSNYETIPGHFQPTTVKTVFLDYLSELKISVFLPQANNQNKIFTIVQA